VFLRYSQKNELILYNFLYILLQPHVNYFNKKLATQIKIPKNDLLTAVDQCLISADQVNELWDTFFVNDVFVKPSRILQFTYYLGALSVMFAMIIFMTLSCFFLEL